MSDQRDNVIKGFEALRILSQEWPDERLASIAGELYDELAKGPRAPMVEYVALKGDEAVDESLNAKMQDLVKATRESSPKFQQPCFQCLGDYQTAVTAGLPKFLAGLTLAACLMSKLSIVKEITIGSAPNIDEAGTKAQLEEVKVIRILFLAADPTDASRLHLGEELREIQEKLQLAKLREHYELHQRISVRPADVSQALLDVQPQIVHFSGHGMSTGELCFETQTIFPY